MKIVPVAEVVGQVDIAVGCEAVGRQKIVRFVAGKRHAFEDEDQGAGVVGQESDEEENDKAFF